MVRWSVLGSGAVGAVLGAAAVYVSTDDFRYGGREHVDLAYWAETRDAWTEEMVPGARWATEELCGADLPCDQAVRADTLTVYRFPEREDAVATARDLAGEAYLSGWIVVRFEPGELTPEQRAEFAAGLDCSHVGITEDGVEC